MNAVIQRNVLPLGEVHAAGQPVDRSAPERKRVHDRPQDERPSLMTQTAIKVKAIGHALKDVEGGPTRHGIHPIEKTPPERRRTRHQDRGCDGDDPKHRPIACPDIFLERFGHVRVRHVIAESSEPESDLV